jgi:tetratricopeptide (TPR) repeat protein
LHKSSKSSFQKPAIPLVLLSLIVLVAYSNTFHAAWQMDDKPNILDNSRLHIDNLMPETLYKTFFASPGSVKKLYRPLPCFTFAINWYLGKDNPVGYHAVNLCIHILSAFVLFLTIRQMLNTPALECKFTENHRYHVALLSACLWALNPIQTQAVTYIVQRMTSMAALFYLWGLYAYIKARLEKVAAQRALYYCACVAAFVLGVACKENAAIFPLAVILIETVFFPKRERIASPFLNPSKFPFYIGLLVFLAAALYFTKGNPFFFLNSYEIRSFSLSERLLTEFRVIVLYISQIFYPHPDRLSIDHGIPLSTSLIDPWTTLPAIGIVTALVILGISQIRRRPLLGFSILFFFMNHLIESTILPLEIIFEHRNYLPSAFVFLPAANGLIVLLNRMHRRSRLIPAMLISCIVIILISLGTGTYLRNTVWSSQLSLWADAARKAPGNARPLNVLAIELGWNQAATPENLDRALFLFHKSLGMYRSNQFQEADILGNIAAIHFKKGEHEKAAEYYQKTLQIDPFFVKARYHLAETLAVMQKWEEASQHLDLVLKEGSPNDTYHNLKGLVLLWQNRPKEALPYLRKALSLAPWKSYLYINIGVALSRAGANQNAEWFLNQARRLSPGNIIAQFCQVENSLRGKDLEKARRYTQEILSLHSLKDIQDNLEAIPHRRDIAPVAYEVIRPVIQEALLKMSAHLAFR